MFLEYSVEIVQKKILLKKRKKYQKVQKYSKVMKILPINQQLRITHI